METIIQQFLIQLCGSWMKILNEHGLHDIDAVSSALMKVNNTTTLELLNSLISKLDGSLLDAREVRKELGLKVKERERPREYMTVLGWLKFNRSYYFDEISNKYTYPIDMIAGISGYERIGPVVGAALVNSAIQMSMRSSSKNVTGGDISAQSVCNKVRCVGVLEKELPSIRREIDELHIFADEDHVSLQNGKSKDVPLISICEGIKKVGKNRHATVNTVHFTSDISDTDTLWKTVYAYASKAYDLEKIKKICIHGDGGSWIKKGCDEFSSASFFLDGYHLHKRLLPFLSPETSECVNELLRTSRKDDFITFANGFIAECKDITTKKTLRENLKYITNQWDGIVNRYSEGAVGSCTEAMISHVLSERLSRDPMGWSTEGLNAMAGLRVYMKNGGVVTREHFRRSGEERQTSQLSKYADEMMKSFLDFQIDQSIFEHRSSSQGKITPIGIIMKSLGAVKTSPDHCKN